MNQDKIGNFIKSIRLDNNLTQKEFADKFGVTYQAVSKWENGNEILNGEKSKKRKKIYIIPLVIIVILVIIIFLINNKKRDFEFKTISSSCSDFKITGSAAYNKDKTSIYISNIEFCGKNSEEKYKKINCELFENNKDIKKKISSCKEKKNVNIVEYLQDVDIKVDNYNSSCKKLTSNKLILEITAINEDNKNIIYTIPIKLNDSCKQG